MRPAREKRFSFGSFVLLPCITAFVLMVSGCADQKGQPALGAGSEPLGRFNRSLLQASGHAKACFDRNGMTSRDLSLIPKLSAKIHQELVERTGGVINPFPEGSRTLPWCADGQGYSIRVSLLGSIFDKQAPSYPGLTRSACAQILPTPHVGNNYKILQSSVPTHACAAVFTKVIYDARHQSSAVHEGRIASLLLHELLHSYGLEHEVWHPSMKQQAQRAGHDMSQCVARHTTPDGKSSRDASAENTSNADINSIMNYCSPAFGVAIDRVRLSEGDITLLIKLYGQETEPPQTNETLKSPGMTGIAATSSPNNTSKEKAGSTPSSLAADLRCTPSKEQAVEFSSGWVTSYFLYKKSNQWSVEVKATSRLNSANMDWGIHPVAENGHTQDKFVTYLSQNNRILEHRTPNGTTLRIQMNCH